MVDNIIEILNTCLSQVEEQEASDEENSTSCENHGVNGPPKDPPDKGTLQDNIIRSLIIKTIEYIGKDVIFNDEVVKLSWHHVEPYLYSKIPDGQDLCSYIDSVFVSKERFFWGNARVCAIRYQPEQEHEQIAVAYIDFLNSILPLRNTEYPTIINNEVVLTYEQYAFCNHFTVDRKGDIARRDLQFVQSGNMLLKTLRADEFDFSYQFILGIIPGENNSRRLHNLRYVCRQHYTITPKGHIARRVNKEPLHTPEEKIGFSQTQSCTLIDEQSISPAFGFTKDRHSKLYGLMTNTRHALISRLLVDDSGTVSRIFDYADEKGAKSSEAYTAYQGQGFYPKEKIRDFEVKNAETRQYSSRTNEVLARLRFDLYKSVVSICSDTLEARLLAYDFAEELLEHYRVYVEKSGATLNPRFKIPIIFYISKPNQLGHEIKLYTDDMRKQDQEEALKIYHDANLRSECFKRKDYEFLLGLPEEAIRSALFECVRCGKKCGQGRPLVLDMIENGYMRMLSRLLRATREGVDNTNSVQKQSLRDELVDYLVKDNIVKNNDFIISRLILAEEFELADKFIAATHSDKYQLTYCGIFLMSHLINRGNPRQLNYMGLEKMLMLAAQKNSWVVITLCLKEYPNLSKELLGKLLFLAGKQGELAVVDRLLKMGANTIPREGFALMSYAAFVYHWSVVGLIAEYPTDAEDRAEYGYALIEVVRHGMPGLAKLILQAGAKPTWRSIRGKYELHSTLFFAIWHGFNDLLLPLIEHEKHYQDNYSTARYGLALSLAYEKGNQEAIELLEANFASIILIDPVNIAASICRRVIEAVAARQQKIAERSLLKYCYQYRLLTQPNGRVAKFERGIMGLFSHKPVDVHRRQVVDGLRIIMPHFYSALKSLPSDDVENTLECSIKWLLQNKEPALFEHVMDLSCFDGEATRNQLGTIITKTILRALSLNTKDLIKRVADLYFTQDSWKQIWKAELDYEFDFSLRHGDRTTNGTLLLYDFGPALPEEFVVTLFDYAVDKNNLKIAAALFKDPSFSGEVREKLFRAAVEWDTLSDKNIISMISNDSNVTPEMIRFSAAQGGKDLLLHLLDVIQKNKYGDSEYQWYFFGAFHRYAFEDLKVAKKLMSLLGPSLVRHFLLIELLLLFKESNSLKTHNNFRQLINLYREQYGSGFCHYVYENYDEVSGDTLKILQILGNYLDGVDNPKDHMIRDTYKTLLGYFERILKEDSHRIVSYHSAHKIDFKVVYRYMKQLNELLSQCEAELREKADTSQPLLEDPSWTKEISLSPYFTYPL